MLSLQLPFAVIPLLHFVGSRTLMGEFALGRKAMIGSWSLALFILRPQCHPNLRDAGLTLTAGCGDRQSA